MVNQILLESMNLYAGILIVIWGRGFQSTEYLYSVHTYIQACRTCTPEYDTENSEQVLVRGIRSTLSFYTHLKHTE